MNDPKSIWLTPPLEHEMLLQTFFPERDVISILNRCGRLLWTGINQKDALLDGKPFVDGTREETMGYHVLRWIQQNKSLNGGMGPTIGCGALAHLFIAACAAYSIDARLVASAMRQATDGKVVSDITAEYWDEKKRRWIHVIPWCKGRFASGYYHWSKAMRDLGPKGSEFITFAHDVPVCPALDYFLNYVPLMTAVGVISNGNAAYVDASQPYCLYKVWDDLGADNPWKDYVVEADVEKLYGLPISANP